MRILCLSIFLAGLTSTIASPKQSPDIINQLSSFVNFDLRHLESSRLKRDAPKNQTSKNSTSGDDGSCVSRSVREFQEEMKSNSSKFGNLTNPYVGYEGHQFYNRINEDALKSLCKLYIPHRKQIDGCPNSTFKAYASDALAIFDFLCLQRYDDLNKQMPCLRKSDPDISSTCTPKCSDAQDKAEGFNNIDSSFSKQQNATGNLTASSLNTFSRFCKHVKCLIQCQTPIVKKQCGLPAVQLIHDGVHLLFQKLNRLNSASSLQDYWPKVCSELAAADFNT